MLACELKAQIKPLLTKAFGAQFCWRQFSLLQVKSFKIQNGLLNWPSLIRVQKFMIFDYLLKQKVTHYFTPSKFPPFSLLLGKLTSASHNSNRRILNFNNLRAEIKSCQACESADCKYGGCEESLLCIFWYYLRRSLLIEP